MILYDFYSVILIKVRFCSNIEICRGNLNLFDLKVSNIKLNFLKFFLIYYELCI